MVNSEYEQGTEETHMGVCIDLNRINGVITIHNL
jgi:hypothetical protein